MQSPRCAAAAIAACHRGLHRVSSQLLRHKVPAATAAEAAGVRCASSAIPGAHGMASSPIHPRDSAVAALRRAHAVCFDVDSTVITVEAIDEFAAFAGKKEAVAKLTAQAMGGSVKFQDALEARLSIIAPTRDMLGSFLKAHPFEYTPGVRDFVSLLQQRGTAVYLVSGGFTQMINPIADQLGISRERVFANTILFDGQGAYAGFDTDAPTSRDGGKPEVVRRLKAEHGYPTVVMIGDGATDMQARPPADAFVGYGGVVVREAVRKGADWYVSSFDEVIASLR